MFDKKNIPARDPKQCGGAKGQETSGGGGDDGDDDDDDDDHEDTQMRAHRSRYMRAHESRHMRAKYGSTHMRADICEHTYESTHMEEHI